MISRHSGHLAIVAAGVLAICMFGESLFQTVVAQETIAISDTPQFVSTYSPEVLYQPGWDRFRMYYGSNDGTGDRIYLAESFGQGTNPPNGINNWQIYSNTAGSPIPVLAPAGVGEGALIHDPTVFHNAQAGVWSMYYSATDLFNGQQNRVFHATSSDGVHWTKQGALPLPNIENLVYTDPTHDGYYNPGILRLRQSASDDRVYLYFYGAAKDGGQFGHKLYATSMDLVADPTGHAGWSEPVAIADFAAPNPAPFVDPQTGRFGVTFDAVTTVVYNDELYDLDTYKTVLKAGFVGNNPLGPIDTNSIEPVWFAQPSSAFATQHAGTATYLPTEGLLYVAGNPYASGFFFDDGQIGVVPCAGLDCAPASGVNADAGGPYVFRADTVFVSLDGTASSNIFGNNMAFRWRVDGVVEAAGAQPILDLASSGLTNTGDVGSIDVAVNAHVGTPGRDTALLQYESAAPSVSSAAGNDLGFAVQLTGVIGDADLVVNAVRSGFERLQWEFSTSSDFGEGFLAGTYQGTVAQTVGGFADPFAAFGGSGTFNAYLNVRDSAGLTSSLGFQISIMPIAGDFDDDGDVDGDDFLIWQSSFNSDASGDADGDGDTDGDDFLIWQSNFGSGGAAGNAVPEPSSFVLCAIAFIGFLVKRRR